MTARRHHKLLDFNGQPIEAQDIGITALTLIDREALPGLPTHMEGRLLNEPGLEPALVLFHSRAEVYRLARLTTLPDGLGFGI